MKPQTQFQITQRYWYHTGVYTHIGRTRIERFMILYGRWYRCRYYGRVPVPYYRVAAINPEFFSSYFQMTQHS